MASLLLIKPLEELERLLDNNKDENEHSYLSLTIYLDRCFNILSHIYCSLESTPQSRRQTKIYAYRDCKVNPNKLS